MGGATVAEFTSEPLVAEPKVPVTVIVAEPRLSRLTGVLMALPDPLVVPQVDPMVAAHVHVTLLRPLLPVVAFVGTLSVRLGPGDAVGSVCSSP